MTLDENHIAGVIVVGGAPEMIEALGEWEKFLHEGKDIPPLVQCALIHHQFEAIGNLGDAIFDRYSSHGGCSVKKDQKRRNR